MPKAAVKALIHDIKMSPRWRWQCALVHNNAGEWLGVRNASTKNLKFFTHNSVSRNALSYMKIVHINSNFPKTNAKYMLTLQGHRLRFAALKPTVFICTAII